MTPSLAASTLQSRRCLAAADRALHALAGPTPASPRSTSSSPSTPFPELTVEEIRDVVDGSSPDGSLRLLDAQLVPPSYHATFSTRWRRYVYLLPSRGLGVTSEDIHRQLAPLAGVRRDYAALGRGLPRGKDTSCHFHRASASAVTLPRLDDASLLPAEEAIRIELIADRFLRRQVRTLVSSAVWAAQMQSGQVELPPTLLGDEGPDGERLLLTMATSGLQEQTAHPAPARSASSSRALAERRIACYNKSCRKFVKIWHMHTAAPRR